MTIGAKLGIGFGTVIALLAISAVTAYYNVSLIQANMREVLDEAVPMVRSCDRVLANLNEASASLRGCLAFGTDPKALEIFKASNTAAWEQLEKELNRLVACASALEDAKDREQVDLLVRTLHSHRNYHERIIRLAEEEDNVPVWQMFNRELVPRIQQSLSLLTGVLDKESSREATAGQAMLLKAVADGRESYVGLLADIRTYLFFGDEKSKRAAENSWRRNDVVFQALIARVDELVPAHQPQWDQVIALHEEISPIPAKIFQMRGADDWNRAQHLFLTESFPQKRQIIIPTMEQIISTAEERESTAHHELEAASRTTMVALGLATAISIVIGCGVAVVLSRRMATTVRALADRAQQISEGDLRGTAVVVQSADELGQLADGFNVMLANLRDLTGQILSVTENVNSAASQVSSSAKQQATSTKEQAATVQEITSTMQEISQSGSQIVAKAKEVAAVAEQASSASKTGMDAVQSTNRTMEAIREQVEEVAENIVALSEKTQAVGEIISTVNEIAEQSNLLALNATIEAAEAGEEGSRFSVVAGEMKNLADQAKECTIHVRKILGEIQKAINTSVMLTEEAVKRVESGKQQADVSENVIRQISSTTEESIQAFQQIIGATNQQQVGLEQVARGMNDIDQAAQQTSIGTGQLEQAVVNLSAMSKQLRTAVASYKV